MKIELNNLSKLNRYKENLLVSDNHIFSYLTKVANINHITREVKPLGYWSVTTSKHINYVANEYGYKVVK